MAKLRKLIVVLAVIAILLNGVALSLLFIFGGPDGQKSGFLALFGLGVVGYVSICLWLLYYAKERQRWAIALVVFMAPAFYWMMKSDWPIVFWIVGMVCVLSLAVWPRSQSTNSMEHCRDNLDT